MKKQKDEIVAVIDGRPARLQDDRLVLVTRGLLAQLIEQSHQGRKMKIRVDPNEIPFRGVSGVLFDKNGATFEPLK